MDGDGWDDADEHVFVLGTVLRYRQHLWIMGTTVFLGGADRRTPMAALMVSTQCRHAPLDLTEDDPMAKALELNDYQGWRRATNLGPPWPSRPMGSRR